MSWRREVASATTALALLGLSASPAAAQDSTFQNPVFIAGGLIRNAPTPYHFVVYDDVPSDENSPYWPHDFWSPLKFIPFDSLGPGSYINFGGEDRERIEHWNTPLFGLTPRQSTTYDLHRLLFSGDLHIDDSFRTFIQFSDHDATSASLAPGLDVDQIDLPPHYYRLHGPNLVIEYDNTQNEANHIHSVWHDPARDFGADLLRRHYEHLPHRAGRHGAPAS